ncbi:mitochondrial carrier [Setomelanomma holmii]|uniref:Mitochondrial carrier n=1 Tax=Setomelanomma holmii TaxID=210430 RepID=A0A9P4LHU1_9PLEO|nr:mitochondrial carrier [Setomelanomma holmii]
MLIVRSGVHSSTNVHYLFWFGGSAAAMATCLTHPLELATDFKTKVRLQTQEPGPLRRNLGGTSLRVVKNDGVSGLHSGMFASLLRQLTYWTAFRLYVVSQPCPGFVGGVVGNVADVLTGRMQNDTALPLHERRNYRGVIHGLFRMTFEEGSRSWRRGWLPNSGRGAVSTAAQLATYDAAKAWMINTSCDAGYTKHAIICILRGRPDSSNCDKPVGHREDEVYVGERTSRDTASSTGHCQTRRREVDNQGWVPSFMRQGPHTMGILFLLEMHRKAYQRLSRT